MVIKEIKFDDIKEIVDDYLDYFNNYEGDNWQDKQVVRRLRQLTDRFDYFGIGIYIETKMIGFCVGCLSQFNDGIIMHLNEIFIVKKYQSQGYGSKLLLAFEEQAKNLGAFRVQLETLDDDIHHRFYNKYHQYQDTKTNIIKGKSI